MGVAGTAPIPAHLKSEVPVVIKILGFGPSCIWQGRPKRAKREPQPVGAVEKGWLNLKPFFKTPVSETGLVSPHGTAKPHNPPPGLTRSAEIWELARTQHMELPSMYAEFRANGLTAISLSSSPEGEDDDEMTSANIAQKHLKMVPYDPDPETVAPLMRRIEWERFILACSGSTRIYAKVKEDGSLTLATPDKTVSPETLATFAGKVRELVGERSPEQLTADRDRAAYYGSVVWASMTPEQQLAWKERGFEVLMYLDPADDNRERIDWLQPEETSDGGPAEIGLHSLDMDLEEDGSFQHKALYEPSEYEFWPFDESDIAS